VRQAGKFDACVADLELEERMKGKREELMLPGMAPPISHYCDAVRFGELLFISGIVGVDGQGKVVGEGDAARQTRQIFENMRHVLAAFGAGFGDVLKVTVFLTNIEDRARINPVRQEFFGAARPASTLVEVSRLVRPDLLVEIEAVVGLPNEEGR
jgi:2-iminobutanoate/2-iminopropanoate deaminase